MPFLKRGRFLTAISFVLLLTLFETANAQFQAMRLLSGVFEVAGNAISQLPAACVTEHQRLPVARDVFTSSSDGILVTRLDSAGQTTRPLNEVLGRWIRIKGSKSVTHVTVEPVRAEANVRYKISVSPSVPGVVGPTASDIAALMPHLIDVHSALKETDSFGAQIKQVFGSKSGIYRAFLNSKADLEWDVSTPTTNREQSINAARQFKDDFTETIGLAAGDPLEYSPGERLKMLTVNHGEILTPLQIAKVKQVFGVKISSSYEPTFRSWMRDYVEVRNALSDSFGPNHELTLTYESLVTGLFDPSFSQGELKELLGSSSRELLDPSLDQLEPGKYETDVIALTLGSKLSDRQRLVLGKILGHELSAPSGALDNCVLLSEHAGPHSTIEVRTTQDFDVRSADEITANWLRNLIANKRVIVEGRISKTFAGQLNDAGAKIVQRFDSLVANPDPQPKKVRVIVVSSEDPVTAAAIFENQALGGVIKGTKQARLIPDATIVQTRSELTTALQSIKADERALVIFHHGRKGLMLDQPMSVKELTSTKGSDALSCNLYDDPDVIFPTNDALSFETTIGAVSDSVAKFGNRPVSQTEFFEAFQQNYQRRSFLSNLKTKALVIAGTVGGAGVLYIVHAIAASLNKNEPGVNRERAVAHALRTQRQLDSRKEREGWNKILWPRKLQQSNSLARR